MVGLPVINLVPKDAVLPETTNGSLTNTGNDTGMGVDRHMVARVDNSSPGPIAAVPREGCIKRARALPAVGIYRPPAARRQSDGHNKQPDPVPADRVPFPADTKPEKPKGSRRRPDIQVYVPRAKRASAGEAQGSNIPSPMLPPRHSSSPLPLREPLDHEHCTPFIVRGRAPESAISRGASQDVMPELQLSNFEPNHRQALRVGDSEGSRKLSKSGDDYCPSKTEVVSSPESRENSHLSFENFDQNTFMDGSDGILSGKINSGGGFSKSVMAEEKAIDENNTSDLNKTDFTSELYENDLCGIKDCEISSKGSFVSYNTWEGETQTSKSFCGVTGDQPLNAIQQDSPDKENEGAHDRQNDICEPDTDPTVDEIPINNVDSSPMSKLHAQVESQSNTGSFDIFTLSESCSRKKDNEDDCRKREEQNRKNRRILRGNFVSDVLIISDQEPCLNFAPPKSTDDPRKSPSTESLVKKKKVRHIDEKSPENGCPPCTKLLSNQSDSPLNNRTGPAVPSLNPEECTWEMMFDDNGECLDPTLMEELTKAVGQVDIQKPQSDYRSYQTKLELLMSGSCDEFSHVIEVSDFPPEFKTEDLLTIFLPYKNGGFDIKWVDDTHALGVFSSSVVAAQVLAADLPFVKTRPLSQATHESRIKARRSAEFLQPYRARPETCAALARRLVTASLGVKLSTSREEREAEKKLLKEAREKKRLAARQREEAWEGTLGDH
uniref:Uncharacterized protein n=1 Tax=Timema tahoe TaxID=61484 RepID=A0A7R9FIF1_9NEOP|nr:unnamed protein product [Timema tahoe]